jgi:myosin-5
MVAARVNANDKGDHLLLPPETEEAGPYVSPTANSHQQKVADLLHCMVYRYQLPAPREIENLETCKQGYS